MSRRVKFVLSSIFLAVITFSVFAFAGSTITMSVSGTVGTRAGTTSVLTPYTSSDREFQCVNCIAGDSVRVDASNDGVAWVPFFTFTGAQAAPVKFNDRSAYYSTVRLASSGSTLRVVLSLGNDNSTVSPVTIRYEQPSTVSATTTTCLPIFSATTGNINLTQAFYSPVASVSASSSDYIHFDLDVYDGSGSFYGHYLQWDMGFTGNALTRNLANQAPLTAAVIPFGYSACVQYTKNGSGSLPAGVFEFVTQ